MSPIVMRLVPGWFRGRSPSMMVGNRGGSVILAPPRMKDKQKGREGYMRKSRRDFIRESISAAAMPALASRAMAQQPGAGIPTRRLGRTNQQVSILCLGGSHIGSVGRKDEPLAIRMMHRAIDEGVNFFDNAWTYNNGYSEEVVGKALKGSRRQKVFVMTKNSGRDTKFATQCLEDSLRRLAMDHIDLWQFHETNWDNDPDWVFERGGLKVALEAQKAGKVRFIGFTGHKDPRIHLKMLGKPYDWATSQMPINVMDYFYRSFQKEVVPVCLAKDVGVIGMKSLGGGGNPGGVIGAHTDLTPAQCLKFTLGLPIASMVRGWTAMDQMMEDIRIVRDFKALPAAEKQEILTLAEPHAGDGRYEMFKTTQRFDQKLYRDMHGFPEQG